jgi:hypothetical protein
VFGQLHQNEKIAKVAILHDHRSIRFSVAFRTFECLVFPEVYRSNGYNSQKHMNPSPNSQSKEPKPQKDVNLLINDIDSQKAQSVFSLNGSRRSIIIESTFRQLWKHFCQRINTLFEWQHFIGPQNLQTILSKLAVQEHIHEVNLEQNVDEIHFMDMFLNGQFTQYGLEVLRTNEMLPLEERVDPLAKVFPKLSKCTFNDYGPSGTVQRKDALCLLAVNIINEKIYIFLWFWFFTLAVWTGIHMLLRIVTIASVNFRKHQAFKRSKGNAKTDTSMVVENCNFGDFFILMQLAKHLHPGIFREFIIDLRQELTLKNRPSLLIGHEDSKY